MTKIKRVPNKSEKSVLRSSNELGIIFSIAIVIVGLWKVLESKHLFALENIFIITIILIFLLNIICSIKKLK